MDPRLDYARELERRDVQVAARVEHVAELGRRADDLRLRAEAIASELARLPERREHVQAAWVEAERELAGAREGLAEAERTLPAAARGTDESARLRVAQAETEVRSADERRARLLARLAELDGEEQALRSEAGELENRAAELVAELHREPRTASTAPLVTAAGDLVSLQDWAARAHAAVLVARSGLEAERDRIVREANELAASVLGESAPAGVATVRGRLESALS